MPTFRYSEIDHKEQAQLLHALKACQFEFLLAYDSVDDAFKYKIDGGIWSPPIGKAR